jgi:hypothetical protein
VSKEVCKLNFSLTTNEVAELLAIVQVGFCMRDNQIRGGIDRWFDAQTLNFDGLTKQRELMAAWEQRLIKMLHP